MVLLHEIPETGGIACCNAVHALAVAQSDCEHFVLVRNGFDFVAVAAPHVRHVDSKEPHQAVPFAGGDVGQCAEETGDAFVVFRLAPAIDALRVGAAQDGKDADVRTEDRLQVDHLEFDRVLDGMAIVFGRNGGGGEAREFVDQRGIGLGVSPRSGVGFAGESEALRSPVVRRSENHERAVFVFGPQQSVGGAIGLIAA